MRYHYKDVYLYAYNLPTVTGNNLNEPCKKPNGVTAENIQRFVMV